MDREGNNSIIVIPGANGTVTGLRENDTLLLDGAQALLLQLETPLSGVIAAARAGRSLGVTTVLTPAPAQPLPQELLECVDVLLPNQYEAATITGEDTPERALAALLETVPEVIITLGSRGALYGARDREPLWVPVVQVEAVDTTGAGDTFCGAYAVARTEGQDPESALRFAAKAAALSVRIPGASTSMPTRAEIDAF